MNRYLVFKVLALLTAAVFLFGCDAKDDNGVSLSKYVPAAAIDVSMNGYDGWSDNIKELVVGQTFHVRITVAVKGKKGTINYFVNIPDTEVVDITLTDADGRQEQVPLADAFIGGQRYKFNAISSKNPRPAFALFRCRPLVAGDTRIELSYDAEKVSDSYWKTRTLEYLDEQPNQ
jgi:hypothetical protein